MVIKADFHTHSVASPDGALDVGDYRRILKQGTLDYIAVTDHNTIAFAKALRAQLGHAIIVGEEITAKEGEIIGLYLSEVVPPGLSAADTVLAIHAQGGLVYIPHPFETVRKGLPSQVLTSIASRVDVMEVHNGRAVFQNRSAIACEWAIAHTVPGAASSDAHGWHGWGRTYTLLKERPTRNNLPKLLTSATLRPGYVGFRGILYPKLNRMRKKVSHA